MLVQTRRKRVEEVGKPRWARYAAAKWGRGRGRWDEVGGVGSPARRGEKREFSRGDVGRGQIW